jgi:hypothetical protein
MIFGVWRTEGGMDKELRAFRTRDLVKGAEGHATDASMEKTTLHVSVATRLSTNTMGGNYIFSLQPTFTQGLIIGQLSIIVLLGLVLKYLFLDSTQEPFERSSYHPRVDSDLTLQSQKFHSPSVKSEVQDDTTGSTEWLNVLLRQVRKRPRRLPFAYPTFFQIANVYRSKLRDDQPGSRGDEVARRRLENYVNTIRPMGFLVCLNISVRHLPRLMSDRTT